VIKALKGLVDYFKDNPALKKQRDDARRRFESLPQLIERQKECGRQVEEARKLVNDGEKTIMYLRRFEHDYTTAANLVASTRTLENYLLDTAPEQLRLERQRAKKRLVQCTGEITSLRFDIGQAQEKIARLEKEMEEHVSQHNDYSYEEHLRRKIRDARIALRELEVRLNDLIEDYPQYETELDELHAKCLGA
jgi:chromosome segregation ATPase